VVLFFKAFVAHQGSALIIELKRKQSSISKTLPQKQESSLRLSFYTMLSGSSIGDSNGVFSETGVFSLLVGDKDCRRCFFFFR